MGRFDIHFLDSLLILVAYLFGALFVAAIMYQLSPPIVIDKIDFHPEYSILVYIVTCAYRFLVIYEVSTPWRVMTLCYLWGSGVIFLAATLGKRVTINEWLASLVPCCVLVFISVPWDHVWLRVKPLPRTRKAKPAA